MRKFMCVLALSSLVFGSSGVKGCGNSTIFDTVYTYRYGIIKLQDGSVIEGEVQQWCDYEGDQLQVTIDGQSYLVHASNCTLMVNIPEYGDTNKVKGMGTDEN